MNFAIRAAELSRAAERSRLQQEGQAANPVTELEQLASAVEEPPARAVRQRRKDPVVVALLHGLIMQPIGCMSSAEARATVGNDRHAAVCACRHARSPGC